MANLDCDRFDRFVFSPGPGLPSEQPIMRELLEKYAAKRPVLGVCLGMQAIAEYAGGTLFNLKEVKHGQQEEIHVDPSSVLFACLTDKMKVGLYHSWGCNIEKVPSLRVTAKSKEGVVMAFEDLQKQLFAVQFHPESILTEGGIDIFRNFLYFNAG